LLSLVCKRREKKKAALTSCAVPSLPAIQPNTHRGKKKGGEAKALCYLAFEKANLARGGKGRRDTHAIAVQLRKDLAKKRREADRLSGSGEVVQVLPGKGRGGNSRIHAHRRGRKKRRPGHETCRPRISPRDGKRDKKNKMSLQP